MLKTILSFGSPGSGKSTVALSVAWELVSRKNNVLVLNTDSTVPMLPIYLPNLKTNSDGAASLGSLLDTALLESKNDIFRGKILPHPDSGGCLAFSALTSGENPLTYKSFEKNKIQTLFSLLNNQPIDYVIIDGQSNAVYNSLTLYGLENADITMRIITPDTKGVEWTESQLRWLSESININAAEHIKIANRCLPQSAVKPAGDCIGGFDFVLPENNETYISFSAGERFGKIGSRTSKEFGKQIKALVGQIQKNIGERYEV